MVVNQSRIDAAIEEYYTCRRIAYDESERVDVRKYYLGRATGIKFALGLLGVCVEEYE